MNLASRCRGAISHVAMLKKELANIQQQHQQHLLEQQQQHQRSLSSSSVLPTQQPQPQTDSTTVVSMSSTSGKESVVTSTSAAGERRGAAHPQQPQEAPTNSTHQRNDPSLAPPSVRLSPPLAPPKSPPRPTSTVAPLPLAPPSAAETTEETPAIGLEPRSDEPGMDPQMDQLLASSAQTSPPPKQLPPPPQASSTRLRTGGLEINTNDTAAVEENRFAMPVDQNGNDNNNHREEEEEGEEDEDEEKDPISELPSSSPAKSTQRSSLSDSTPSPPFPHSASPKLGRSLYNNNLYNEQFPGDITSVSRLNSRNRVTTLGGFDEEESDLPPLTMEDDKSTISSIDAFEASFHTNFPDSFATATTATSPEARNTAFLGGHHETAHSISDTYNPFSSSPHNISPSRQSASSSSSSSNRNFYQNKRVQRADPPGKNRTSPRQPTAPVHYDRSSSLNTFKTSTGAFSPTLVATTSPTQQQQQQQQQNLRAPRSTSIASFHNGTSSIHNMTSSSYSSPLKNKSTTSSPSLVGMTRQQPSYSQSYHSQQQQPLQAQLQSHPLTPPSNRQAMATASTASLSPKATYKTPPPPPLVEREPSPVESTSGNRSYASQYQQQQHDSGTSSANSARHRYEQAIQPSRLQLNGASTSTATNPSSRSPVKTPGGNSNHANSNVHLDTSHHHENVVEEDSSSLKGDRSNSTTSSSFVKNQSRRPTSTNSTDASVEEQRRMVVPGDSRSVDSASLEGVPMRIRAEYALLQQQQKAEEAQQMHRRHQSSPSASTSTGRFSFGNRRDATEKPSSQSSPVSSGGVRFSNKRESSFEEKKVDQAPNSSPPSGNSTANTRLSASSSHRDFGSTKHRPQRSLDGRFMDHVNEEKKSETVPTSTVPLSESATPVSVRDRVSLFSSAGSPRSPEVERVRLNHNTMSSSPNRLQQPQQNAHSSSPSYSHHVRSGSLENMSSSPRAFMVDDGDIPLVSSIRRTPRDSFGNAIQNNSRTSSSSYKRVSPWVGDEDVSLSSTITGNSTLGGGGTVGGEVPTS